MTRSLWNRLTKKELKVYECAEIEFNGKYWNCVQSKTKFLCKLLTIYSNYYAIIIKTFFTEKDIQNRAFLRANTANENQKNWHSVYVNMVRHKFLRLTGWKCHPPLLLLGLARQLITQCEGVLCFCFLLTSFSLLFSKCLTLYFANNNRTPVVKQTLLDLVQAKPYHANKTKSHI